MRVKGVHLCKALHKCGVSSSYHHCPNGWDTDLNSHTADGKSESLREELAGSQSHICKGAKPGLIPGFMHIKPGALFT